jgi:chemotaxis protein MotB
MSRRQPPEEPESDDFMVLFTALSMILLAFFIMLNSLATVDDARTRVVVDSLVGTFGVLPGFKQSNQQFEIGQNPNIGNGDDPAQELMRLATSLLETGEHSGVHVEKKEDGRVVVRMDENVLFGRGHIHVSPLAFDKLDKVARLIHQSRIPVRIEGHSDAVPTSGERSNWYLSAARAATVYRYLQQAGGVDVSMMSAAGYADTRPPSRSDVSPRRVEIVFLPHLGGK